MSTSASCLVNFGLPILTSNMEIAEAEAEEEDADAADALFGLEVQR